jgi:hypothetical protein
VKVLKYLLLIVPFGPTDVVTDLSIVNSPISQAACFMGRNIVIQDDHEAAFLR